MFWVILEAVGHIRFIFIFEICVSGYRDKQKVTTLLQCKCMVGSDSVLYDRLVPAKLEEYQQSSLPSILLISRGLPLLCRYRLRQP